MAASILQTTDSELCRAIASGGDARMKSIEVIYNWAEMKEKVIQYVRRHGGSESDGLDIFHDGIIALDKNIRLGKYRAESGLQGYLYSICRFIWNNEWRRRKKISVEEIKDHHTEADEETPDILMYSQEESAMLRKVMELLDESCKKILTLWKLSYTMTEIASQMNLSSPEMAKKYRYRCMQKLLGELDNHPHLLNALKYV